MTIAWRFVLDRRRSLVGWGIAALLLILMTVAFYPTIRDQPSIEEVMRDLPDALKATFGVDDAVPLGSPAGYLQARYFSFALPLALVIFAIGVGARAVGGAEEDGEVELVLAQPVTRRQLVAGRYGAVVALTASLGAAFAVLLSVLGPLFGVLDGLSLGRLLFAGAAAVALALLHASVAFCAGAVTGRRSAAVGVGSAVAVGGYLLQGLLAAAHASEAVRFVSPWHWFLRRNMLVEGLDPLAMLLPLGCSALLVAVSLVVFARRDLT